MAGYYEEFAEFVAARAPGLHTTAYLLCGDWHRAEDLVQTTMIKVLRAWSRVRRAGSADAYVRQVLVRTAIDDSRRFWRRERPSDHVPELATPDANSDVAVDISRALAALPSRQRAAVVLRYWDDLPVQEVARLMGCSEGTVKSHAAHGLAALRRMITDQHGLLEGHHA